LKPSAPVFISTNRYDPFTGWGASHQLAIDWCDKGADVQLWTNEQPPFLNKMSINHLLPYFVDGERGMQWVADRFNGKPTSPNCAETRNE
jgi:triacylglycerol lipase